MSAPASGPPPYAELHCHSAYSFGDGASLPAELAGAAAELGYEALALTDHDGVWGAMELAHACRGVGIRSIVGAELTVGLDDPSAKPAPAAAADPAAPAPRTAPGATAHLTLLVESAVGWRSLCRLLTEAHAGTREGSGMREPLPPVLPPASLERSSEGLVCLTGCAREGAVASAWNRDDTREGERLARRLLAAFGRDRFRIELQRPLWRRDRARNRWQAALAERIGVPAVATGDVHAHDSSRARLQDALVAVRLGETLDESERDRRGNAASVLRPPAQIAARFADHPEAVAEAARLAERLDFDLTRDLGYRYPGSEDPTADRRLAELCRARITDRYGPGARDVAGEPIKAADRAEAERRLEEELRLIRELRLSGFFLLHHEMLELARAVAAEVRGPDSARSLLPPGRGRGSSVSSIVCYLTGLSHIDPVRNDLFLGRFLNEELDAAPDIDLDFPRDIREKLLPRVHERYGHERSALVAAFATYRTRGAVRDLGKALGLPPGEIERVARGAEAYAKRSEVPSEIEQALGRRAGSPRWRALAELVSQALGLPRHISQHPGGMVISTGQLIDLCPVQPAAMEGRQMVQWDKDSCADAGFLKIDLLGLGMLSAVERCVEEIGRVRGERIDLSRVPLDDPECWRAIQRAETTGVFQIESRAQMQMLLRTLPENLDDLTVQVALVRPGPIQGGAVHPYIERRKRLREDPGYEIPYEHPSLEPALRDTLGAIVFQDQVLEVAIALAGFSPGEAEGLRRAMSRRRSEAAILRYRERFIEGAIRRGVAREVAARVFSQIEGFSGFGFPKSHSAAFGLLAYQSTWLRVNYGPEFLCALLNEQPMGFYPPDALVHEAQRRGIEVLPADVNRSAVECHVERKQTPAACSASRAAGSPPGSLAVRIGLGYVNDVVKADAEALVAERERGGAYADLADLASRSGGGRATLERLAWSGACDELVTSRSERREALWRLGAMSSARRMNGGSQLTLPLDSEAPELPALEPWEKLVADYRSTGIAIDGHPMELMRAQLEPAESSASRPVPPGHLATSRDLPTLPDRSRIEVAGMVVARQRPATANGVVFMLLEDEWGVINLIVPPPVVARNRLVVRTAGFVRARGRLERAEGPINVVVFGLERLEAPLDPGGRVRTIEPPHRHETGRHGDAASAPAERAAAAGRAATGGRATSGRPDDELAARRATAERRRAIAAELAASLPAGHSFGRRGR